MSKEIIGVYTTGKTLYAFVFSATGQAWNTTGTPAFENITSVDWTAYAVLLTEATTGTGIYTGNFPSTIMAGTYSITGYVQAGGSPAVGDLVFGTESNFGWDGSKRVTQADLREILGTASVGAAGYTAPDWGHVNAPTTTVNLSGTTIATSQVVASVTGAVGSVTGSVGSVTGNVGGNVAGSVASVTGGVGGNVAGTVASVVGNVGGNVVGSTASVTGNIGGNLIGNVNGNVVGSVGSVIAGVTANVTQWVGTNVAATNTAGVPVVDTRQVLRVATAQAGGATSITLDSGASSTDNYYRHAQILILSGTGSDQAARTITASVGVSKIATVTPSWAINPDATSIFQIVGGSSDVGAWNAGPVSAATSGIPDINVKNYNNVTAVTDGNNLPSVNTADIAGTPSAGAPGYAALDWSQIHAPTSTVNLSNTNIDTNQVVASVTGAVGSVTSPVTVGTNNDKTGYALSATQAFNNTAQTTLVPASLNAGNVTGNLPANLVTILTQTVNAAGAVTFPVGTLASTTNLTAGTITTTTNLTNLPAIPNNWLTAAGIASGALDGKGDWNTVTPPTVAAIATGILTDTTSGDFAVVGSPGHVLVTQLGGTFTTASSSIFSATALENTPAGTVPPTAAAIATAVWQDLLSSGDFGVSGSVGALIKSNVVTTVTNPVTVGTNLDKTNYELAFNGVDAIILEPANGSFPAINLRQGMCLVMDASPAGLISGVTTAQVTIKNQSGNTTRIVANVDANGNRMGFSTFNPPA